MARFDVMTTRDGARVLDCQANLLSRLRSRFVVPLFPVAASPVLGDRLNPILDLPDGRYVMVTQAAATIDVREIDRIVVSLAEAESAIMNALDMLLTGY
jgi:hypothetical protein